MVYVFAAFGTLFVCGIIFVIMAVLISPPPEDPQEKAGTRYYAERTAVIEAMQYIDGNTKDILNFTNPEEFYILSDGSLQLFMENQINITIHPTDYVVRQGLFYYPLEQERIKRDYTRCEIF